MTPNDSRGPGLPVAVAFLLAAVLLGVGWYGTTRDEPESLVVYCAHDSLYSQQILDQFTRATGIPVRIRFDTEATKSLGLVNLLRAERENPRCDVFWNNQVLGTLQLAQDGVLEPYKGPGYSRIPDQYRDPEGYWAGFGGRLRVTIVNTTAMRADEQSVNERLAGPDLSRTAIAQPEFGTTLSHFSVLWKMWGPDRLKAWHAARVARGIRVVSGNATVKNLVAAGTCDFGWTDTDDYFVARDAGLPVEMLPVRLDDRSTICIPNSVAIIRGTTKRRSAERLVDFLLSAETELALADSRARQIPLGPVDETLLPEDVRQLRMWASDAFDLRQAAASRLPCLEWLQSEHLQ